MNCLLQKKEKAILIFHGAFAKTGGIVKYELCYAYSYTIFLAV